MCESFTVTEKTPRMFIFLYLKVNNIPLMSFNGYHTPT